MKVFSQLIFRLESTSRESQKLEDLINYFESLNKLDAVWALYFLTGEKIKKIIDLNTLSQWAKETSGIPNWLFEISYSTVGDQAETIALILPRNNHSENIPFGRFVTENILTLLNESEDILKQKVINYWSKFETAESIILNKILSGTLKAGKFKGITKKALSKLYNLNEAVLDHTIAAKWNPTEEFFRNLISNCVSPIYTCQPYPFHKAVSFIENTNSIDFNDWLVEWKYDGIRAQLIKKDDEVYLWSRNKEFINEKFPEIISACNQLPDSFAFDGIIICKKNFKAAPSTFISKRISKRNLTKKDIEEIHPVYMIFDLLEDGGKDISSKSLVERRTLLDSKFSSIEQNNIAVSELVDTGCFYDFESVSKAARKRGAKGVILKKLSSSYNDQIKENWLVRKAVPFKIDAVLMYVQRNYENSFGLYSEFTFGIWKSNQLVSFAKIYPNIPDDDLKQIDSFIKLNTTERIGPVKVIKPQLVFEIAFDNIEISKRHKCGFLVRNPQIINWQKEKLPDDAGSIEFLNNLLP